MERSPSFLTYPLPLPFAQLHPDYRPGDLADSHCTIAQYADLPAYPDDRYDLVRSQLQFKPADDPTHDDLVDLLILHLRFAGIEHDHQILRDALVYIPPPTQSSSDSESSVQPVTEVTVRRVDVCIVPRSDGSVGDILGYRGREKPKMVLEVTTFIPYRSTSRRDDLVVKWDEYERAGVAEYLILDRDYADPAIFVGSLRPYSTARRSYRETTYRADDVVQCSYFSEVGLTAARLLLCDPSKKKKSKANGKKASQWKPEMIKTTGGARVQVKPMFDHPIVSRMHGLQNFVGYLRRKERHHRTGEKHHRTGEKHHGHGEAFFLEKQKFISRQFAHFREQRAEEQQASE